MSNYTHSAPCDALYARVGSRGFPYCAGCFAHLFLPDAPSDGQQHLHPAPSPTGI